MFIFFTLISPCVYFNILLTEEHFKHFSEEH